MAPAKFDVIKCTLKYNLRYRQAASLRVQEHTKVCDWGEQAQPTPL
jgi:hypothetical protein